MPRRPLRALIILLALLAFFLGPSLLTFYTNWLWFGEVGYQQVFATMLRTQGTLFTIAFALSVIWLTANFRLALRAIGNIRPVFTTREGLEVALPGEDQMRTLALLAATLLSVLIGLFASNQWETWLAWRNATSFGQADPVLGRDVSFYVFTLPFLQVVRGLGQAFVIIAAVGAGALYLLSGSLTTGFPARLSLTPAARRWRCCRRSRRATGRSRWRLRCTRWSRSAARSTPRCCSGSW